MNDGLQKRSSLPLGATPIVAKAMTGRPFDLPAAIDGVRLSRRRWIDTFLDSPQDIVEWEQASSVTATPIRPARAPSSSRSLVLKQAEPDLVCASRRIVLSADTQLLTEPLAAAIHPAMVKPGIGGSSTAQGCTTSLGSSLALRLRGQLTG